jgi:hypothetical protein
MKKVVSLLLAVVLVFSMATVALAGNPTKKCPDCGFTEVVAGTYDDHIIAGGCGRCSYCDNGFETAESLNNHKYICTKNSVGCDYCGDTFNSQANYDNHIEACKPTYFNIPLAKIIATVKDLIAKIDFSAIIGTVKDKVVPAITDFIGGIDFSAIKLPA